MKDTLGTLRARIAALGDTWTDEKGTVHERPTAWAYAQACAALDTWRLRAQTAEAALDQIMVGGNHLASALIGWLGAGEPGFPPYSASLEDARKLIADVDKYDAWVCWKFIMLARDARVVVEGQTNAK